jgi:hypothetical protein
VGFTDIEEEKRRLMIRSRRQLLFNPIELTLQAPRVPGEMETLERSSQDGTGLTLRIEPIHGPTAKSAVTAASESFDQIRSLKLETVTVLTSAPGKSHPKQLAGLGVEPGIRTTFHAGGEAHPHRGMAAVSEITGCLSAMQRTNG